MKSTGEWIEIETDYLFNNQYNTVDGRRIYDQDVSEIENDARANMGRCRYCGAMIRRGEDEKHFAEREAKSCAGCFWWRERTKERSRTRESETTTGENGEKITRTIITTVEECEPLCSYAEVGSCKTGCTLTECRAFGIEWFTPENTFFLKYPKGFSSIPEVDKLGARGFAVNDYSAKYYKKLGSYTLEAVLTQKDGKPYGVQYYRVWNCRSAYQFRYEDGELYTNKYSFGWYKVKTLEGVPANVMHAIRNICNH